MIFTRIVIVVSVVAFVISGCQTNAVLPDIEAETTMLRELSHQWASAESNKDLEAALDLYWDDAVMLVPDQGPIEGMGALRPAFEQFFQLPFTSLESDSVTIQIAASGDLAYSWANYSITFPGPDSSMVVSNKFIAVWEKRNDEWKIIANMSNSNPAN